MSTKIKMRSVSVEDLGNIVKQMIGEVLEDHDQVTKLRQAVFEEYYLKKVEELKQVKAEIDTTKFNQEIDDLPIKFPCKQSNSYEMVGKIVERSTPRQCEDYTTIIVKSSKSDTILNLQKNDTKAAANSSHNEIDYHKFDEEHLSSIADDPVEYVVKRPKHGKASQELVKQTIYNCNSNIALTSTINNTSTNIVQTISEVDSLAAKHEEKFQVEIEKNISSNVEIIERQHGSLTKDIPKQFNVQFGKSREVPVDFKSRGESAFENWKKEKTNTYHRIFKEEQKKKSLEQAARAKQMAKKEAANEAYLHWRRQQDARQKLIKNTKKQIVAHMEFQKLQLNEKRNANSQAFKAWKRQKDIKLRERKMYMMAYNQQYCPQPKVKPQKPRPGVDVAFNIWLDQLDCVLHQKYLRERRYLVHSFYCQPAYFGTAALCTR